MTEFKPVKLYRCPRCLEEKPRGAMRNRLPNAICVACSNIASDALHASNKAAMRLRRMEKVIAKAQVNREAKKLTRVINPAATKRMHDKVTARKQAERAVAKAAEVVAKQEAVVSDAEREMAMRVLARRRFLPFVLRFKPDYQAGWVHREIAAALEWFSDEVAAERSPRLIITLPPRSGKSELVSVNFPAWHLGRHPMHDIISCSHTASLAGSFSRRVRDLLRDRGYGTVFETRLSPDSQAIDQWTTVAGGGYLAAGVGGPIVGRGAHVLVIDDPVKNKEEADSATERQSVQDWYATVAYTRLAPGGGVLLMLQRWHMDDLAGWQIALQDTGGEPWRVLNFPAIATEDEKYRKKGEALHPARYDVAAYGRIKANMAPRDWEALYQQNPVPEDGEYFKRKDIVFYEKDALPPTLRYYAAWDLAIGIKESNDYSVGVVVGIDFDDTLWVVDVIRGRWGSFELSDKILDSYQEWKPDVVGIERGQIELAIGPYLEKRQQERKLTSMYVEKLLPGKRDKFSRARSIQGRMQQGRVRFPKPQDKPWMTDVTRELLSFGSGGKHDDVVDALAWIGLLITEIAPPRRPVAEVPPTWREKLKKHMNRQARSAMAS